MCFLEIKRIFFIGICILFVPFFYICIQLKSSQDWLRKQYSAINVIKLWDIVFDQIIYLYIFVMLYIL